MPIDTPRLPRHLLCFFKRSQGHFRFWKACELIGPDRDETCTWFNFDQFLLFLFASVHYLRAVTKWLPLRGENRCTQPCMENGQSRSLLQHLTPSNWNVIVEPSFRWEWIRLEYLIPFVQVPLPVIPVFRLFLPSRIPLSEGLLVRVQSCQIRCGFPVVWCYASLS